MGDRDEEVLHMENTPRRETVLITGATGFLGEYLVKLLVSEYLVRALGRNRDKGEALERLGARFCQGDFTDESACARYFEGVDYVIHAGALSTVWGEWEDFYKTNTAGTATVAKLCIRYGIRRLVYISSPSIYTEKRDRYQIREEDFREDNELNYYIKSKILAEREIKRCHLRGLETVILRPRGLIGIGDTSLVPRLLRANKRIGIPLFNGGSNIMDLTSVDNVALACRLAMTAEHASGEVFNITNGEPAEFKVLLEQFLSAIGEAPHYRRLPFEVMYGLASGLEWGYRLLRISGEPPITRYTVCTLGFGQTMDISKARKLLGYQPVKTLAETIEEYGAWWREQEESKGSGHVNEREVRRGVRTGGKSGSKSGALSGGRIGVKSGAQPGGRAGVQSGAQSGGWIGVKPGAQSGARGGVKLDVECRDTSERRRIPGLVEEVRLYHCGFCTNNLKLMFKNRSWEKREFPATAVLIRHRTQGNILFDTGYSERIMHGGPLLSLYRLLNPVSMTAGQTIRERLERDGIEPESIQTIILSHAHPDHIGGLSQFSGYELIATGEVMNTLRRGRIRDLVFRELLPEKGTVGGWACLHQSLKDHFLCNYFDRVYDIFEDGSVIGVVLEGHSRGQLGIWIPDHRVFLAADACWGNDLAASVPHMRLAARIIQENYSAYRETVAKLCRMKRDYPEIRVVFTHQKGRERSYVR